MKIYNLLSYLILPILVMVALSACEDETIILGNEMQNQIRVVGKASMNKAPDIATSQIGVQTFNKEVEPAVAENNRKSDAVISALRQQGIAEKDIYTTQFNIYPQRDYANNRPNEIIGFQVDNMVSVTIRDIKIIGKALQTAINAGANNIHGLNFTISDTETIKRDLRLKAIQDARKQAEDIAAAADIKLGKIITINDLSMSVPIYRANYDKAAAEIAVPIQTGELELSAQVEIVFEISEK